MKTSRLAHALRAAWLCAVAVTVVSLASFATCAIAKHAWTCDAADRLSGPFAVLYVILVVVEVVRGG